MVLVVVAPRVILLFERLHGSSLSLPAYEHGSVDTTARLKITNSLTSLFTIFLFSDVINNLLNLCAPSSLQIIYNVQHRSGYMGNTPQSC